MVQTTMQLQAHQTRAGIVALTLSHLFGHWNHILRHF